MSKLRRHLREFVSCPRCGTDSYKDWHKVQYPDGTTVVYSNFTPRAGRIDGVTHVVRFGLQYAILKVEELWDHFFRHDVEPGIALASQRWAEFNFGQPLPDHWEQDLRLLHKLQYLPVEIHALKEGSIAQYGIPTFVIFNTLPEFFWLTNFLETMLSAYCWGPQTSATTSLRYRQLFNRYAKKTCDSDGDLSGWQGHDFSLRGLWGFEAGGISGASHLLFSYGTDNLQSLETIAKYYGLPWEELELKKIHVFSPQNEPLAGSVPATEHSVMCAGLEDQELQTIKRIVFEVHPEGIVSVVADTWDFWDFVTVKMAEMKAEIMERDGKFVVRPDSSPKTPYEIICGDPEAETEWERKGAVQCLWDIFGGTKNSKGYKVLDPHVGLIYGDSITPELQAKILAKLDEMGFATSCIVLGIGSFTYTYVTRDTHGAAMKATAVTQNGKTFGIQKSPKTSESFKKSHKGFLKVVLENGEYVVLDEQDFDVVGAPDNLLQPVYRNSELLQYFEFRWIRNYAQQEAQRVGLWA